MDDKTISTSVSSDREEFIAGQIAAGNYADAQEVLRAGLEILRREARTNELRGATEAKDVHSARSWQMGFNEPDGRAKFAVDDMAGLRFELESSENSGTSLREIPDIIASVKAKLRAHGSR